MLKRISLSNFKSYGEEEKIPINKLTLLFGPNGGGKSSVIQSITHLQKMLGKRDSYIGMFNSNENYPSDEKQSFKFEIANFEYLSIDISGDTPELVEFKSDFELGYTFDTVDKVPSKYTLVELKRQKKINDKWEVVSDEVITIFKLENGRLKIAGKYTNSFHEYYLTDAKLDHPYWLANLAVQDYKVLFANLDWFELLKAVVGKSFIEASKIFNNFINDSPEYKSNPFDTHEDNDLLIDDFYDFDEGNNLFNLSINRLSQLDISFISRLGSVLSNRLRDSESLDSMHIKSFITLVSVYDRASRFHPFISNLIKPFSLLMDEVTLNELSNYENIKDFLEYETIFGTRYKTKILNWLYRAQVLLPIREIPKKLNIESIENHKSDLTYRKLIRNVINHNYNESIDGVELVNIYLNKLGIDKIIFDINLARTFKLRLHDQEYKNTLLLEDYTRFFSFAFETFTEFIDNIVSVFKSFPSLELHLIDSEIEVSEMLRDILSSLDIPILEKLSEKKILLTIDDYLNIQQLFFSISGLITFSDRMNYIKFDTNDEHTIRREKLILLKKICDHINLISDSDISKCSYGSYIKKMSNQAISDLSNFYKRFIFLNEDNFDKIKNSYREKVESIISDSYELFLLDTKNFHLSRFNETGTGFSQVFPVVINSALHVNRLIAIEQPELHLHPGLQANLADVFISSVRENKNQFILETHSEHLIKAIQLNVAKFHQTGGKEGISKDEVSLVYISKDPETGKSKVKEMILDESGSFVDPWPDDFFDSSADLTYERLKMTRNN